ncbi:MAG: phosphocholine cytidylyltransferase family protein, partial [Nanoarchaeota archaeon]
MIKKALILAAGFGSRLLDYTEDKPKSLVNVKGKPILEYQLEALTANNIKEIVIVIGYKGEKIKEFIQNSKFKELNIKFIENKEFASTESSYSLWLARNEIINEHYIHLNCDVIFSKELLKALIKDEKDNVIVIDEKVRLLEGKMEHVILKGDRIIKMDKEKVKNPNGKGTGIAKFSPENIRWLIEKIDRYIADGDKGQNFYTFIREGVHFKNFYGMFSGNNFIKEVNTIEELQEANK